MYRVLLHFVVLIFLVSCSQTKESEKTIKKEEIDRSNIANQEQNKSKIVIKDCGMTFDSFFDKFKNDSAFQGSRVKYPLKLTYFDLYGSDQNTPIEEYIKFQDYQFFDFTNDIDAENNKVNVYKVQLEKKDDQTYLYYQLGIDNGIRVEFKFVKEKDCWLLESLIDEST